MQRKGGECNGNTFPTTTSGTVARSGRNTLSKDAYAEFTSTWASTSSPTPKVVQTVRRDPPDLQLRELGDCCAPGLVEAPDIPKG